MPSLSDLKQSKYLTKADVEPPILVTIRGYERVNVAIKGAESDMRWILTFDEVEKPLVLNSTKGQIIAKMTGVEAFDGWVGHKIVLFVDPNISYQGRITGGIACRAPRNQPVPAPKTAPTPVSAPKQASPVPIQAQPQNEPDDSDVPF